MYRLRSFSTRFPLHQSSRWWTSGSEKKEGVGVGGSGGVEVKVHPVVQLLFVLSYPGVR